MITKFKKYSTGPIDIFDADNNLIKSLSPECTIDVSPGDFFIFKNGGNEVFKTTWVDIKDYTSNTLLGATDALVMTALRTTYFFRYGSASGAVTADDVSETVNRVFITPAQKTKIDSAVQSNIAQTISAIWTFAIAPIFSFIGNTVDKVLIVKANTGVVDSIGINDVGVPADSSFLVGNGTDIVQRSLHDSQILLGIYPLTYFSSIASKVITDQNENTMFPTGVGSTTIQVTDTPIIVGSKMKLRLSGFISSAANAGNSTMKIKVGGLTIITSVLALSNNLTNVPFDIDLVLTFRTVGASATVIGNGISQIYNGANGVLVRPLSMTAVSSTFSTLVPIVVDTTLQFVNTGNSITVTNATITIER